MAVCANCSVPLPDGSHFCSHCGTPVPGRTEERPTLTPQGREIIERLQKATVGRYEIVRELGRGGMAVVFLGYQNSLDRHIAIKVLLPLLGYDPEIVERFLREARTQAKLDHPSIISVYEIYNEGGLTFFTMPYISGHSLRGFLRDQQNPSFEKVQKYLCQAAEALSYAHRRGVIHRDVKPDNMLLDLERDCVILTDFGIAKALAAETTLTTPGDLLGTPQYMSPEQGEGKQDLDGRADQYSLGLIGYEMLAGVRPFQAENLAELMYKHRFEEPEDIDTLRPEAPRHLREAIKRAICKDRDERFPTMDAFRAALQMDYDLDGAAVDRTQPMETGADEETTVRVPTPPSFPPKTPRPALEDSTTPEPPSRAPSQRDFELTTPEPWAAPPRDTPQPPVPSPRPRARPPDAETAIIGLSARRRRGRRRGLVWGTLAVVVLAAAGLFLVGPLRPEGLQLPDLLSRLGIAGGDTDVEDVVPAEGSTESGAVDEPGVADESAGTDAPGALAEGGGEPAAEPPPAETSPDAAASDEGAAEGSPTGPPVSEDQPASEEPSAATDRVRQQAQGARQRARSAREAAVGTAGVDASALAALDRRLASADQDMEAGRYEAAWRGYSSLIRDYDDLVGGVTSRRSAAAQAREVADEARSAAMSAGAGNLFASEVRRLDQRASQAERAMQEARYADAMAAYGEVSSGYEELLDRTARAYRDRAEQARTAMEEGRQAAVNAGAADRAAQRLATVDQNRAAALRLLASGEYAEALSALQETRQDYQALATELSAQPEAPDEPGPEEETEAPAETVVRDLLERFRRAFEAEDLGVMATQLYRGPVPSGDGDLFSAIFDRADELQVSSDVQSLRVSDTTASAEIRLDLRFQQSRTGQRASMGLDLRLTFLQDADGWKLQQVERR